MAIASMFSVFEDQIRQLIGRIAEGEGLDADELMTKYLGEPLSVSKKTKTSRAAKVSVTPAAPPTKCAAKTAKGKPCSLNALAGSCMCRIHADKAPPTEEEQTSNDEASGSGSVAPTEPAPAPAAPKKKKPAKKKSSTTEAPPVHTHTLDGEHGDDESCELCQTHGNALTRADEEDEEEFEAVTSPRRSLRQRLMEIAHAEEDFDEE